MAEIIPQSVTKRVLLKAYLSSDHVSVATSKTIAVVISKNGGAFGNPSAGATNATEIASGWYYVDLSTTDTGTAGPLIVRGTAGTIDDTEDRFTVANAHNAGFDGVPNAAAEAAGGLYTRGTGAGQINQPANGQIDANAVKVGGTTQTGRDIGLSVLLSSGTGTGQLDFTSGVVKANLAQILGTALTETAGQLAGGFKKFFNIATPASTMDALTLVATATNVTNAPTSGDFTSTMKTSLNAATPAVTVSDKTGFSLSTAGIQAIWDRLTSALTTVGSIGKLLVDNIDAAISSRSTYAGGDTSGTTTLLSRLTSTRAGLLDHLDADISSRSTYAGGDTAGTTTLLSRLTSGRAGNLDNLDAAVSTRLAASGYTEPDNTSITAIKAKTDLIPDGLNDQLQFIADSTVYIKERTDALPDQPAAVGSAMTLTSDYDAAKTAAQPSDLTGLAQPGDKMDIVDIPNGIAVATFQTGLSTLDSGDIPTAEEIADNQLLRKIVWNSGTSRFDVYNSAGDTVIGHLVPTRDAAAEPIIGVTPA